MFDDIVNLKKLNTHAKYESFSLGCNCGCEYHSTYILTIDEIKTNKIILSESKYCANITNNSTYSYENINPTIEKIYFESFWDFYTTNTFNLYLPEDYLNLNYVLDKYKDQTQINIKKIQKYFCIDCDHSLFNLQSHIDDITSNISYVHNIFNILKWFNQFEIICKIFDVITTNIKNIEHDEFLVMNDIQDIIHYDYFDNNCHYDGKNYYFYFT